MSEWIDFELKEATTKIGSGATPRGGQEAYKEEGISLIRSQNILDFSFSYNGLAFIDDEQADKLKNVIVEEEDVLINITGDSVARVTKVPTEVLPARVNQHVAILRADKNKLDPDYLLYYLLNPAFKRHLLRIASDGATRNALTKTDLEELIINAPKKVEDQKEIAKLLSVYDQKITFLRQQNQTLEELVQTLFKRWFVDFEFPNENGQPYKSSGGKMVDSELGEIPEGWRAGEVSDFVKHSTKSISPSKEPSKIFSHYSIPAFDSGRYPTKDLGETILSNKYIVLENSILVSKLNPSTSRIWTVFEPCSNGICSTEIQVFVPNKNSYAFSFGLFHYSGIKREMAQRASGTSSSHQRVRPRDILNIEFVVPKEEIRIRFEDSVLAPLKKVEENQEEIQTITQLRDTFLPKLMSGELTINQEALKNV
jgi:type I restriction enzyme, S subunit